MKKEELVKIIKKEFYQCDLAYLTTRGFSDLADTIMLVYGNPPSIACKNENMGRCQGYAPKGNSCFSCYWNNTSSEDCIGCIGFGNWRKGV